MNVEKLHAQLTELICIRNGSALKLREDVVDAKGCGGGGGGGEEQEVEEEARLVTARVDLTCPSVFRDDILRVNKQPYQIFFQKNSNRKMLC